MEKPLSVSLSGKAGDVSSLDEVSRAADRAAGAAPSEALIRAKLKGPRDGFSAFREAATLFSLMRRAPAARAILALTGLLTLVLVLNVVGELRMNRWQGSFFRAIETKNFPDLWHRTGEFLLIMGVLLSLVVAQYWLLERVKIRFRAWLTRHLLDGWLAPGRAYRMGLTQGTLTPDQRIQEDVANFARMSGDLGIGALRSSLMLVCFVGVLWGQSRGIGLPVGGGKLLHVPGYMVWFALGYAGLGTWLAGKVGRPLIDLNEERYAREARFRHALARVNEHAESIAFYRGEEGEQSMLDLRLRDVLGVLSRLSFANARLTWIACGHGWLVVLLPVLVALPGYMQGKLDFGGLMMVVGAFNQVQTSLRWFVDEFWRIADWRASFQRVMDFHRALEKEKADEVARARIDFAAHDEKFLELSAAVTLATGATVVRAASARIQPGERVLLAGASGTGKSTLFRAAGGLWPWGAGKIRVPQAGQAMFLPQKPYLPLGTLRTALEYPRVGTPIRRERLEESLRRVHLEALIPRLDEEEAWDKILSLGQQQRLAFARVFLHRPEWVFLDEATSALDDENQDRMMSLFEEELAHASVISIAHRPGLERFHHRTLRLLSSRRPGSVLRETRATRRKATPRAAVAA